MPKSQDPRVSEFDTEAEAESHDCWLSEQVRLGLADDRPAVAHDEVMAEMATIVDRAEQRGPQNC
ncbi:stability determinant [Salinisphaera japonica]|uniref:Stability determinant n=1 Tax=Salinisphaera japonica YTM-1 TaxID=1209778 RepID=A0A423PE07_9GAMM|nr:stability determinant [Salinisphaera japonica]ROO23818.1 stability determinant [Salinisphaera japonica YTM-1]